MKPEKETEEKLRREIEGFFEGFDEDADNLYQEEYQLLTKGKYKLKLKYPESFYEHWEKKFSDFVIKIKQQATTQTLTQVQERIDKIENKVNTAKFSFPIPTEEEEQRYKDLQISILEYLKQELKSQISKLKEKNGK